MNRVKRRLGEVYNESKIISFNSKSKFIIMSDCHRGQGDNSDNFLPNQILFFSALEHYYNEGFTYIELGDGDELWENRKITHIIEAHSDVFKLMSEFYKQNRLYMLFGNHDIVKKKKKYTDKHCQNFYCGDECDCIPLFPDIEMTEGLILYNIDLEKKIFLAHGHQGSLLNDTLWPVARFLVRYVWKPLELIGFVAPTGAARPHRLREKIEKRIEAFAEDLGEIVITGHTHRPVFQDKGLYVNDGSGVHPSCITGIEIENNRISLIKWEVGSKQDGTLYVKREVIREPVDILKF